VARPSLSGINGIAATAIAAGLIVAYSGIKNLSIRDTLRGSLDGRTLSVARPIGPALDDIGDPFPAAPAAPAESGTGTITDPGGGGTITNHRGDAFVAAAKRYIGRPYVFGGEFAGGGGGDCSGLVVRALRDIGINVPRLTAAGFLTWQGAYTVTTAQRSAGDLVCWPGHIGIAVDHDNMVNAARRGTPVRIQKIWGSPVTRRPKL
jgi:hypothetical protein